MNRTHAAAAALAIGLGCGSSRANESVGSEFSHLLAGAAFASAATVVADHYGVEQRAWVGFGTSVGISFVLEAVQIAANGSSQVGPSALDFGSNLIGAAFGAWVTDRYVLQPVLGKDSTGHVRAGLALKMPF
jgi:hypothetical protein